MNLWGTPRRLAPLLALALCSMLFTAVAADAATTYHVDTTADGGDCGSGNPCSLRGAITAAADGDTVEVPHGDYNITGTITIGTGITLVGESAANTEVIGDAAHRVFNKTNGAVTIRNLTLTGGLAPAGNSPGYGGGIYQSGGDLVLDHVAVTGNTAECGGGGGVANLSDGNSLTITHSEISNNTVRTDTGGEFPCSGGVDLLGGGLLMFPFNPLSIDNTTIAGNSATIDGGGIYNGGLPSTRTAPELAGALPTAPLLNTTIAGNTISAPRDGTAAGLSAHGRDFAAQNSIVAGNLAGSTPVNCFQSDSFTTTGGYNIADDTSCGFTDATDKENTDPKLGSLAANGGQTRTMALQDGSPALDAFMSHGCPADDQRDVTRPQNGKCDIGAYERIVTPPADNPAPPGTPAAQPEPNQPKPRPGGPHVVVAGALAGCARSTVTAKISVKAPAGVRNVRVYLAGQRLKSTSKAKFSVVIGRSQLKVGHTKLKVVASDRLGRNVTRTVLLRRCRVRVAPAFTG